MTTDEKLRTRSPEAGFTLIEVLVAMILLAIGLLGLEALGISAARMVSRSDRQTEMAAVAGRQLERALQQVRLGHVVACGDSVGPSYISTCRYDDPVSGTSLRRITVTVTPTHSQASLAESFTASVDVFN